MWLKEANDILDQKAQEMTATLRSIVGHRFEKSQLGPFVNCRDQQLAYVAKLEIVSEIAADFREVESGKIEELLKARIHNLCIDMIEALEEFVEKLHPTESSPKEMANA